MPSITFHIDDEDYRLLSFIKHRPSNTYRSIRGGKETYVTRSMNQTARNLFRRAMLTEMEWTDPDEISQDVALCTEYVRIAARES